MRNQDIYLRRQLGMSFAALGRLHGITGHRARQIFHAYGGLMRYEHRKDHEIRKLDREISRWDTPLLVDLLRELAK